MKTTVKSLQESFDFTPPAPLTKQEIADLKQFEENEKQLQIYREEERIFFNLLQKKKNAGEIQSVALPPEQKEKNKRKNPLIKFQKAFQKKYGSKYNLKYREDYQKTKTQWVIISGGKRSLTLESYSTKENLLEAINSLGLFAEPIHAIACNGKWLKKEEINKLIKEEYKAGYKNSLEYFSKHLF